MTDTTTAASNTDPGNAAMPPVDLYREVHKGLRAALFELVHRAGALDATDADAVESFRKLFAELDMMLETHHGHEDGALLAGLIADHAGDVAEAVEAGHVGIEAQLGDLRATIAGLDGNPIAPAALYDQLATFTADYLDHMQVEEQQVMPRLQSVASPEALMAITMEIRTSVPPPEMCVFLRSMLPAMNVDERTAMLGGMQMGAPPEIFELFWGVAESSLSPADLGAVASRLGLS